MPLVLAIEPDLRQATILKRIVREKVHADVSVVDSPDAALGAIQIQVPDVLLLSALLSPRDEDELIAHLRTLDAADHIQTHTIPQLASTAADQEDSGRGRGLFGVFRRKKDDSQGTSGCDPDLFAEEISAYLQRAAEKKAENAAEQQSRAHQLEYLKESSAAATPKEQYAEPAAASTSETATGSWASPFEWKPTPQERPARVEAPAEPVEDRWAAAEIPSVPEPSPVPEPVYESPLVKSAVAHDDFQSVTTHAEIDSAAAHAEAEPITSGRLDLDIVQPDEDRYDPRSEVAYETAPAADTTPEPIPVYEEPSPIPVYEEPAVAEQAFEDVPFTAASTDSDPEPLVAAAAPSDDAPGVEDDIDPLVEPVAAAPAPAQRAVAALRLAPLAMWARTDAGTHTTVTKGPEPEEPRSVSDELRNLMSALAVPPHVAGVSYARGCRIRRVRVPGGKDRRRGDTPGPVILSKRALEEARTDRPNGRG